MELWEISLRKQVSHESLKCELAAHFGVEADLVVSSEEFIDSLMRDGGAQFGLSVSHADEGYGTLCDISLAHDRTDLDCVNFAAHLASVFDTEVAIGDPTGEGDFSEGRYLVILPDGHWKFAGELANGDVFELGSYSEPHAFDDLKALLQKQ